MKMTNYRKKGVLLGIVLIIVGTVIGGIGFGLAGFDISKLNGQGDHHWYYTIQLSGSSFSYGIRGTK